MEEEKEIKKNRTQIIKSRNQVYTKFFIKTPPIQILFATITPLYTDIIKNAAKLAQMPFHLGRWVPGSINAKICCVSDVENWRPLINKNIKNFNNFFTNNKLFAKIYHFRPKVATGWCFPKKKNKNC